mgnify:CR=1 FL=1
MVSRQQQHQSWSAQGCTPSVFHKIRRLCSHCSVHFQCHAMKRHCSGLPFLTLLWTAYVLSKWIIKNEHQWIRFISLLLLLCKQKTCKLTPQQVTTTRLACCWIVDAKVMMDKKLVPQFRAHFFFVLLIKVQLASKRQISPKNDGKDIQSFLMIESVNY